MRDLHFEHFQLRLGINTSKSQECTFKVTHHPVSMTSLCGWRCTNGSALTFKKHSAWSCSVVSLNISVPLGEDIVALLSLHILESFPSSSRHGMTVVCQAWHFKSSNLINFTHGTFFFLSPTASGHCKQVQADHKPLLLNKRYRPFAIY